MLLSSVKHGKLQCFVDILKRTVTLSVLFALSAVFLSSPTHTIQTHVIIKIGSLVLKNSTFLPFYNIAFISPETAMMSFWGCVNNSKSTVNMLEIQILFRANTASSEEGRPLYSM